MTKIEQCVKAYKELKHLKLVGEKLNIPWQTVYWYLKKANIEVTGDKARHGSIKDQFAAKAERRFAKTVPSAINNNMNKFQPSIDFMYKHISIDIKASTLKTYLNSKNPPRWGFCLNKQTDKADFFILYAYDSNGEKVLHTFLLPREIAIAKTTISIPFSLNSKWADYEIMESELNKFFLEMSKVKAKK